MLEEVSQFSAGMAQATFNFTDYGEGSHKAFRRIMARAISSTSTIDNWYFRYLRTLPDGASELDQFPTPQDFYARVDEYEENYDYDHNGMWY